MLPILRLAAAADGEVNVPTLFPELALDFALTPEDVDAKLSSGKQTVLANRCHWAQIYMRRAGLLESSRCGFFSASARGRELLADGVDRIDRVVLGRLPDYKSGVGCHKTLILLAIGCTNATHKHQQTRCPLFPMYNAWPGQTLIDG